MVNASKEAYAELERAMQQGGSRPAHYEEKYAMEIGYRQAVKDIRKTLKKFNSDNFSGDQE